MSLLDSVIGALGSQPGGGGQPDLMNAVIGLITQAGGPGGLAGLVEKFQQGGLGDVAASWVGTGQNQPVSPTDLGSVLGHDAVAGFAQKLGLNHDDALGQLAQMLPQVVDKLTPNGQLPQGGAGGMGDLGNLAGMLGGLLKR